MVKCYLVAVVHLRSNQGDLFLTGHVIQHVKRLVDGVKNAEKLFVEFEGVGVQMREIQKVLHQVA